MEGNVSTKPIQKIDMKIYFFSCLLQMKTNQKKLGDARIYNNFDGDAARKSEGEVGHRDACLPI